MIATAEITNAGVDEYPATFSLEITDDSAGGVDEKDLSNVLTRMLKNRQSTTKGWKESQRVYEDVIGAQQFSSALEDELAKHLSDTALTRASYHPPFWVEFSNPSDMKYVLENLAHANYYVNQDSGEMSKSGQRVLETTSEKYGDIAVIQRAYDTAFRNNSQNESLDGKIPGRYPDAYWQGLSVLAEMLPSQQVVALGRNGEIASVNPQRRSQEDPVVLREAIR